MDGFNRMCSIEYDIELILSISVVTQEILVNPGLLNWVTTNVDTGQLTINCHRQTCFYCYYSHMPRIKHYLLIFEQRENVHFVRLRNDRY